MSYTCWLSSRLEHYNTTGSSESAYSVYTGKSPLHPHSLFETSQDHKTLSSRQWSTRSSTEWLLPASLIPSPDTLPPHTMFQLNWLPFCSSKWPSLTSESVHSLSPPPGMLCYQIYHRSLRILTPQFKGSLLKELFSLSSVTT